MLLRRLKRSLTRRSTMKTNPTLQMQFQLNKIEMKSLLRHILVYFLLLVCFITFGTFLFYYLEDCLNEKVGREYQIEKFCKQMSYRSPTNNFTAPSSNATVTANNASNEIFSPLYNQCVFFLASVFVNNHNDEEKKCTLNKQRFAVWLEFVVATIHTIGYGSITPTTDAGKLTTILYSAVGIPLTLIMYTYIGNLINCVSNLVMEYVEFGLLGRTKLYNRGRKIAIVNIVVFVTVFISACSITRHNDLERLSWFDSVYFWWITLTTVGYGDKSIHFENYFDHHPGLVLPLILLILLGMAMMAMLLNYLILLMSRKNNHTGLKFANVCCCHRNKNDVFQVESDVEYDGRNNKELKEIDSEIDLIKNLFA